MYLKAPVTPSTAWDVEEALTAAPESYCQVLFSDIACPMAMAGALQRAAFSPFHRSHFDEWICQGHDREGGPCGRLSSPLAEAGGCSAVDILAWHAHADQSVHPPLGEMICLVGNDLRR